MTDIFPTAAYEPSYISAPLMFLGEQAIYAPEPCETWSVRNSDAAWADALVARLAPHEKSIISLAYKSGGPAIAHRLSPSEALPAGDSSRIGARHYVRRFPDEQTYADRVRHAVEQIGRGEFEKVVLGRCLDVVSDPPLAPEIVLARLLEKRPGRYVFSVPLGPDAGAPVLVGASPELLVRRSGDMVSSFPLAGSIPRVADPEEDRRQAESLRSSSKDLAEHAFVVRSIVEALTPFCDLVEAPSQPLVVSTDTLWHLGTPISARLKADTERPSALRLAQLLHPTPAVGGTNDAALALVDQLEGAMRGYLAGCVGWVNREGDGEFAVTIRAGIIHGECTRLFAGAGIVMDSQPEAEVRETGAKLATMARVIGL